MAKPRAPACRSRCRPTQRLSKPSRVWPTAARCTRFSRHFMLIMRCNAAFARQESSSPRSRCYATTRPRSNGTSPICSKAICAAAPATPTLLKHCARSQMGEITEMAAARLVGTPVPRREDARLRLGQARFVADISVPRTLYMAIVRSTKAHAVIEAIDISRAIAAPGVARVVVGSVIADTVGALPSIVLAVSGTAACCRVLSIGKVRYFGEPVAAVFAERLTQANEAADLVDIQYRDLPVVLDTEQAVAQPPSFLYEQLGSNVISTVTQNVGDTDAAFARAF